MFGKFFPLSLSLLKLKDLKKPSVQLKNVLNYQRHLSMSVSDREASKEDEMVN
jgi:hypothetical protein